MILYVACPIVCHIQACSSHPSPSVLPTSVRPSQVRPGQSVPPRTVCPSQDSPSHQGQSVPPKHVRLIQDSPSHPGRLKQSSDHPTNNCCCATSHNVVLSRATFHYDRTTTVNTGRWCWNPVRVDIQCKSQAIWIIQLMCKNMYHNGLQYDV